MIRVACDKVVILRDRCRLIAPITMEKSDATSQTDSQVVIIRGRERGGSEGRGSMSLV